MRRRTIILVGALLALAGLEFALLGVDAFGRTGGQQQQLPPVAAAKPKPTPTPGIGPGEPYSIRLTADPLVIHCDGNDHSTVTVNITDIHGRPVSDGTLVRFSAYDGTTNPPIVATNKGSASTSVVFYADIFPPGPNVIVDAGALEAGIRVRCVPESSPPQSPPPCIPSPGSGPMSPPCPTQPPCDVSPPSISPPCEPTPPPCGISPPSVSPPCPPPPTCLPSPPPGSQSPPCATPPPCGISPPSISPPCGEPPICGVGISPPYATPTPTPGPIPPDAPYEMAIDTDPSTASVDATRDVSGTAPFSIGVDVTRIGGPYRGYQWELQIDGAGLEPAGTAVNAIPVTLSLCSDTYPLGAATFGFGCASPSTDTSFTGILSTIPLKCLADGNFEIRLIDIAQDPNFGTTVLSGAAVNLATHTVAASINCTGAGVTGTPTP